jgi:FAD/FMN-containing dehydrogenase
MTSDVTAILRASCPDLHLATEEDVLLSHGRDWTRFREPAPAAIAFPKNVQQVCALVACAAERQIALVPSGGRTGLSGGAVAARGEVVVSFDRMRRILDFNPIDRTVTVEAGVVTAAVQQLAREKGLYYPVSFAAEGSSQIGGNVATNAGSATGAWSRTPAATICATCSLAAKARWGSWSRPHCA